MKKSYKVLLSAVMVLSLTVSIASTAFAADVTSAGDSSSPITGTTTVDAPTIDVVVPTNLDFALDPLQLKTNGNSQIANANYFFINKSDAPMQIKVDFTATLGGGTTLVSDPATLSPNDTSVTSKKLYLGVLSAKSLTDNDLKYNYVLGTTGKTDPAGTFDTSSTTALTTFTAGSDATKATASKTYALGAATGVATPSTATLSDAPKDSGVADFQLYAKLNTYASWAASDLTISANYTLLPLNTTTYSNYTTNTSYVTDALNELKVSSTPTYTAAGFISGATTTTSLPTTSPIVDSLSAGSTNISVPFYFNGKTITSLVTGTYTVLTTDYSISGNNLVLSKASGSIWTTSPKQTCPMTLTLSDGSKYTFTINVTA